MVIAFKKSASVDVWGCGVQMTQLPLRQILGLDISVDMGRTSALGSTPWHWSGQGEK
jgi:hypothetical protein